MQVYKLGSGQEYPKVAVPPSDLHMAEIATSYGDVAKGKIEIETARLVLRAARNGDELALHTAFADKEVMRYWSVNLVVYQHTANSIKERATPQEPRSDRGMGQQYDQWFAERRD